VTSSLEPGQLTSGWRNLFTAGWVGVVLGLAAVWKSSWTLGFPTWWLGPQSDPRFPALLVLPFILPVFVVIGAVRNHRYTVVLGIAASIGEALIAWGDVGRQDKFALVEFALAAGGLAVSLASLAGLLSATPAAPHPGAFPPPTNAQSS
jgi:hypothetical protein